MPSVISHRAKILFLDIEASNLSANFGHMISFAWKFLGDKKTHCIRKDNYPQTHAIDDKGLTRDTINALMEADILVSWYGERFDIPYIQSRAIVHGLATLPRIPHIDLWRVCRNRMHLHSNRLESAAQFLGCNTKTHLDGEIWQKASAGDKKSIKYIVDHNIEDVIMLEKVYMKMRPLITEHPNVNLLTGRINSCPNCGSAHLQRKGSRISRTRISIRYQCTDCGSWSHGPAKAVPDVEIR